MQAFPDSFTPIQVESKFLAQEQNEMAIVRKEIYDLMSQSLALRIKFISTVDLSECAWNTIRGELARLGWSASRQNQEQNPNHSYSSPTISVFKTIRQYQ